MSKYSEFDQVYAAEQLRRSRHPARRLIKHFYLQSALREVRGSAIDFGCGAGQILERLPPGSTGIEINPVLIDALRARGLDVRAYDAFADDFAFTGFDVGRYKTLVISHVLEHLPDVPAVMGKMWRACARLGIDTIVAVVPGKKGYASDPTHKTFISHDWLRQNGLLECAGFRLTKLEYFPVNLSWAGDHLGLQEMKMVYSRAAA